MAGVTVWASLISVFFVSSAFAQDCSANNDFGIVYDGLLTFGVAKSTGICSCLGGYSTTGGGAFGTLSSTSTFTAGGPSTFNGSVTVAGGLTVNSASGVTINTGGLNVAGASTFGQVFATSFVDRANNAFLLVPSGTSVLNTVTAGAVTTSGGLTVNSASGVTINTGGLAVAGTSTFSAPVAVSRLAGPQSDHDLMVNAGTSWMKMHASITPGAWNPLSQSGDHALLFSDGPIGTGNLVIAPWTNSAYGLRFTGATGRLGVNTASPTATLDVNGNAKVASSISAQSVTTANQRAWYTPDPRPGCPDAGYPVGATLMNQTITLVTSAYVMTTATMIRLWAGRADLYIYVDGMNYANCIAYTDSSTWQSCSVTWAGQLSAGDHVISLKHMYAAAPNGITDSTASPWGCRTS
eukprot:TRINITY_DN911_c0_g1_i4.p1 TRINITY_DN911_c0_g1~~TRINITY_DN911_c0_g1_i4.p1  ORF type:complete len:409 (-),score=88.19 TRINITY_DN911_c0_g1_i4:5-1231(-)